MVIIRSRTGVYYIKWLKYYSGPAGRWLFVAWWLSGPLMARTCTYRAWRSSGDGLTAAMDDVPRTGRLKTFLQMSWTSTLLISPRQRSTKARSESSHVNRAVVTEYEIFQMLDCWETTRYLRGFFSALLAYLVNLSLTPPKNPLDDSHRIQPVAKPASILAPNNYRPISILPILSRLVERFVVQRFIIIGPTTCSLSQTTLLIAFRSTGSTAVAIPSSIAY